VGFEEGPHLVKPNGEVGISDTGRWDIDSYSPACGRLSCGLHCLGDDVSPMLR
jgi:hypothetical protein